jgi:hypothetical protein
MVRFAGLPGAALALFCFSGVPVPLAAQDVALLSEAEAIAPQVPTVDLGVLDVPLVRERRPASLLPLYASFVTLQVLDAHSTWRALDRGAVEANPLMRGIVANEVGLVAVKAAGTAGVILAGERIWKTNRAAGVLFLIAANSAMVWVVQHNYRAVR